MAARPDNPKCASGVVGVRARDERSDAERNRTPPPVGRNRH